MIDINPVPNRLLRPDTLDDDSDSFFGKLPQWGADLIALAAQLNTIAAGGAYAIPYIFDSTVTDADPGPGKLRLSAATQNTASAMRLDLLAGGQDVTAMLDTFDASTSAIKGSIRLVKVSDPSKWLTFSLTGKTSPTGYRNFSLTPIASSEANPFANGDALLLYFQRTGDKGDSSAATPLLHAKHQTTVGTNGGAAVAGNFAQRTLNVTVKNTISGASLSANIVALPAGTYRIQAYSMAYNVGNHRVNLVDSANGGSALVFGSTEKAITTLQNRSTIGPVELVFSAPVNLFLQHYTQGGDAAGLGLSGAASGFDTYAEIFIEKVA